MQDFLQFLLLFSAVGIGWLIGRKSVKTDDDNAAVNDLPTNYYQGLNYLLSDQPDAAIDTFVDSLEVNVDTLDTHLAVGNLLRKRGEVEKAIRIHQNLMARPSLPAKHRHRVHLELARDFISAGLLDRAERLLQELLRDSPDSREQALRHLLEIYQAEREWQEAIDTAMQLLPKKSWLRSTSFDSQQVLRSIAHYYCELAEQSIRAGDYQGGRAYLKEALTFDKICVRASILLARLEMAAGQYELALKSLKRVASQDAAFMGEVVAYLREVYEQKDALGDYVDYLKSVYLQHPSTEVLLGIFDGLVLTQGEQQAFEFFNEQMTKRPTLRGITRLIEIHESSSSDQGRANLAILKTLVENLLSEKHDYLCKHCGFSGRQLHWQCPSCKHWGETRPIQGVEGD